jgi:GNAT superfamily N-acetyltransferase
MLHTGEQKPWGEGGVRVTVNLKKMVHKDHGELHFKGWGGIILAHGNDLKIISQFSPPPPGAVENSSAKGVHIRNNRNAGTSVAARYREAAITFRDESSPRVQYARRFSLCDSEAEPPRKREYLFTDAYRRHNLKTYKRLKNPVLDSRGVTDPCDVAYIDYAGGGGRFSLHLVITREDHRGKGLATRLLKEFYAKKVPKGSSVRWGRIMNPTSMTLFEKMKKARPDVVHMGGKFH